MPAHEWNWYSFQFVNIAFANKNCLFMSDFDKINIRKSRRKNKNKQMRGVSKLYKFVCAYLFWLERNYAVWKMDGSTICCLRCCLLKMQIVCAYHYCSDWFWLQSMCAGEKPLNELARVCAVCVYLYKTRNHHHCHRQIAAATAAPWKSSEFL